MDASAKTMSPKALNERGKGGYLVRMDKRTDYITPAGHAALKAELHDLWAIERPQVVATVSWAASNGDRSENGDYIYGKKRLRQIDSRVRYLRKRLEALRVVDPTERATLDKVLFGATVTYEREDGSQKTVTIVGKDEINPAKGRISMDSPVGRALMNKPLDGQATVHMPGGEEVLEIVAIT